MPSGQKKLRVPDEVAELLRHFHPKLKAAVKAGLKEILANPECGKALKDDLDGLRSYRIKTFRIIYRIEERSIDIVAIGPRRRIYEETFRIISQTEELDK